MSPSNLIGNNRYAATRGLFGSPWNLLTARMLFESVLLLRAIKVNLSNTWVLFSFTRFGNGVELPVIYDVCLFLIIYPRPRDSIYTV